MSAILVAKTSLFRVPQVTERILPFCVLIGAMSCYLNLSRRLELVVARSAGMSAWQFISPALVVAFLLGIFATTVYNPIAAVLQEQSKRYEAELFGHDRDAIARQRRPVLGEPAHRRGPGHHQRQVEPRPGRRAHRRDRVHLRQRQSFQAAHRGARGGAANPASGGCRTPASTRWAHCRSTRREYRLKTSLTPEQVRESFATPETVPFWELPLYIKIAEHAGLVAAGYRLQFQKLLARPFLLAAMVFLAAAVSLRFFRFGGVQKMVLSGVAAGFLLYVLSKVTEDLSKAELMHPVAAAWLPVLVGGLTGFIALLYQEDG